MPTHEAILEKLKNYELLTEEDKAVIYTAEAFDDPDSKIGNTTTLLHQIAILPNAHEIFLTLDPSQLATAMMTFDGNSACYTPLSFLAMYIFYEDLDPSLYQDIICDLVKHSGEALEYAKFKLADYGRPILHILKAIEKCEGTTSASSAASLAEHDAGPAFMGEAEHGSGTASFWYS